MKTDIERVLYYLKSRDTWENYVIARHSLSDIEKLCNKRKYQFCKEDNGLEIKLEEIGKIFEKNMSEKAPKERKTWHY